MDLQAWGSALPGYTGRKWPLEGSGWAQSYSDMRHDEAGALSPLSSGELLTYAHAESQVLGGRCLEDQQVPTRPAWDLASGGATHRRNTGSSWDPSPTTGLRWTWYHPHFTAGETEAQK